MDVKLHEPDCDPQPTPEKVEPALPKTPKRIGRRPKRLGDWRPKFIRLVRRWHGLTDAASKVGITLRSVERARKKSPKFNDQVERALSVRQEWEDRLILVKGMKGSDRLLLAHARAHLPAYGKQPKSLKSVKTITMIRVNVVAPPQPPEPIVASGNVLELPAGPPPDPRPVDGPAAGTVPEEAEGPPVVSPRPAYPGLTGIRLIIGKPTGEPAGPAPG